MSDSLVIAIRACYALGLHRKDLDWSAATPIGEREHRKLVMWTIYAFERFLCASLGRPSGMNDCELETEIPMDWAIEMSESFPLGFVRHSSSLARIMGKISSLVYSGNSEEAINGSVERLLNGELSFASCLIPCGFAERNLWDP
jgi:hypothetical protein